MKSEDTEKEFKFIHVPKAIWFFLHNDKAAFVISLILLNLVLFYQFVPPLLIGFVVDFLNNYTENSSLNSLYMILIILVITSALSSIIRLQCKKKFLDTTINARYRAKVWGFERLLNFSLSWHQEENTGNKAQRLITGSESIRMWGIDLLNFVFPAFTALIGAIITCLILEPLFIGFFMYYLVLLVCIELFFDRKVSKLSDLINKSMENASGTFVESTSNILSVKALGADKSMSNSIKNKEKMTQDFSHKRVNIGIQKWIWVQVHNSISWGIFIFIVAMLVIHGKISVGLVLTYTFYFNLVRVSSTHFTNQFQEMIIKKSNLGRMMPIFWDDHSLEKGIVDFPKTWEMIILNNVSFSYKDKPAVKNINIEFNRNDKIGIAGESGSGKSTLIKLFLGLYHIEEGEIIIGEEKIKNIKSDEITSHISAVLQETELFNLSLKENITLMRDVNYELYNKSFEIACLNELIERLPEGDETLLGEKGYTLSGGERQRIGIARAICKNAPILLLDEATSALDSRTEKRILDSLLGDYSNDKTIFIVAHRISTLADTDSIIVFDNGQIVEKGKYSDLIEKKGSRFRSMYKIQSGNNYSDL